MTDRLAQVRRLLGEQNLDAILITHPSNRFYLSGFTGHDIPPNESAGVLLIDATSAEILASPTNLPWAKAEAIGFEPVQWVRPWTNTVAARIRDRGWSRVGFEDDAILFSNHRDLLSTLNGGTELVPLGEAVDLLRYVKSHAEIEALTAAILLTDEVFVAATANLRAGTTERELAWRIQREMRERGADDLAFPTIVAAGPHGARPHHGVTDRAIMVGEPVVIDMGAQVRGYNGDLTRTVWVGDPEPKLREVYAIVQAAHDAAIATIRAGITGKEADASARSVIADAGYGEYFTHGLGHGLGVRVHEGPSASTSSEERFPVGAVVTVEPGIYIPDWGGVRIEDVVVVEENGNRVLTTAPKAVP